MDYKEIKKVLHGIANTPAEMLTVDDKTFIRCTASELGVEINVKTRCKSCYIDAAVQLYNEVCNRIAESEAVEDERKYILKPNTDVIFGTIRVNEATLTDALAEKIIAMGFRKDYFVKC